LILLNREGKDVFSDEENGTESVKIAKCLMREIGDFLGADKGMQLVNNRVVDPKFKYRG